MASEDLKPDFPTVTVKEGRVETLVPRLEAFVRLPSDYAPSKAPVFYNPVMELNRDLSCSSPASLPKDSQPRNHCLRTSDRLWA